MEDFYYSRGMAFAQRGEWNQAEEEFIRAIQLAPNDKRLYQELAGIYFREREFESSKNELENALRLDPEDEYTNSFLATLYFLEGNLEAAVHRWNHIAKPEINEIIVDPPSGLDPELLDSAFAAAPAGVLNYDDLLATQRRLEMLNAFSRFRLELQPLQENGKFNLILHSMERGSWKSSAYKNLMYTFRGVFWQTINPEFHNINGRAMSLDSMLRWDKEKLRAKARLSMPFAGNAAHRISWNADWRNEEWELSNQDNFELTRSEFEAELQSRPAGAWGWSNGIAISKQEFTNSSASPLFNDGWVTHYRIGSEFDWLRFLEHRFTVKSSFNGSISKSFGHTSSLFGLLTTETEALWHPQSKGEDYVSRFRIGLGKAFGQVPFDELFILGVKSDTKLLMRAHKEGNKRGNNPMGTEYLLVNYDIDKIVYSNSFFEWKVSPFIDIGKINDRNGMFAPQRWLIDSGIQSKFGIIKSMNLVVTYGRNLRNGSDTFFVAGSNEF
ncbi:hypothetical protein L0244_03815 [bacterium]|nr:hypothetical protein [bacterium]